MGSTQNTWGYTREKKNQKCSLLLTKTWNHFSTRSLASLPMLPTTKTGIARPPKKSSKWCSCMNLSSIPTKAEDLHVKVDEKSRILVVSGKSETESTRRDGVKIFSTHVW